MLSYPFLYHAAQNLMYCEDSVSPTWIRKKEMWRWLWPTQDAFAFFDTRPFKRRPFVLFPKMWTSRCLSWLAEYHVGDTCQFREPWLTWHGRNPHTAEVGEGPSWTHPSICPLLAIRHVSKDICTFWTAQPPTEDHQRNSLSTMWNGITS